LSAVVAVVVMLAQVQVDLELLLLSAFQDHLL
jgi:hypothetical protein